MNWYKKICAQYDYEDDELEDELPEETYAHQAWELARNSEINILSDKELSGVEVADNQLLGALWTSWDTDGGFSFDIIVDPLHRGKGVGSKLVDQAISIFNNLSDAFKNPHYDIDAVNESMVRILQRKGFIIKNRIGNHVLMSRGNV